MYIQVFSLLMEIRSEDQVLTPLLTLLLGEPEVQTTSSDFVMIELVYQTPDFNGRYWPGTGWAGYSYMHGLYTNTGFY